MKYLSPEGRRIRGRHAALAKWKARRAAHYDRVIRLRQEMLAACERIAADVAPLGPEAARKIAAHVDHLVANFHELWEFSGHDLPLDMRDYAAGFMDEMRRQARERERRSAPGAEGASA